MAPSPYLPVTRRFVNPLYIRVEGHPGVRLPRRPGPGTDPSSGRGVRGGQPPATPCWIGTVPGRPRRRPWNSFAGAAQPGRSGPPGLPRFSRGGKAHRLRHLVRPRGGPRTGLRGLADRTGATRTNLRSGWPDRSFADRVSFYCWVQWIVDSQLARCQERLRSPPGCGWGSRPIWRSVCTRTVPTLGRCKEFSPPVPA